MNKIIFFYGLIGLFLFSSCMMRRVEYVKNMAPDSLYTIKIDEAIKIQPGDRLSINISTISSKNKDLAAPFNIETSDYRLATEQQAVNSVNSLNNVDAFEKGFLVDDQGYIDYPIFGRIKVSDLSTEEIRNLLSSMLIEKNYINDPLVKVNLLNFKIMVMGDINNGVINVPTGKINLFEAIVRSGGLRVTSNPQKVIVIREENGKRILYENDIEKYDVYNSESYQLRQNDIVYVPAKYRQLSPSTTTAWQLVGMFMGVISLAVSAGYLLKK